MENLTESSIFELLTSHSLVCLHILSDNLEKKVIGEIMFYDKIRRIVVVAEADNRISVYNQNDIVCFNVINDYAEKILTLGNKSRYYDAMKKAIEIKSSDEINSEQDWESALTHYDKALFECGFDDQIQSDYVYTVKSILLNNGDDEECIQKKFRVFKGFKNMLEDEKYELKGLTKYGLKNLTNFINKIRLSNYAERIVEEIQRRVGDPRKKMSGEDVGTPIYHGIDMELWMTAEIINVHIEIFKKKLKEKDINSIKENVIKRITEVKKQYVELQNIEGFTSTKPIKFFNESINRIEKIKDDENLDDEDQSLYAKLFRIMLFQAQDSVKSITPSNHKKSELANEAGINLAIGQIILLYECFDAFFNNIKDERWKKNKDESKWQLRLEILKCYALKYQKNNTKEKIEEYHKTINDKGFFTDVDFKDCPISKYKPMLKYFVQLKMYDRAYELGNIIISDTETDISNRVYAYYVVAKYYESKTDLLKCYGYIQKAKSIWADERKACDEIDAGMLKDIDKMYSNYAPTEDVLRYYTEILKEILTDGKSDDLKERKKSESDLSEVMDWMLKEKPQKLTLEFLDATIEALKEFRCQQFFEIKDFLIKKAPEKKNEINSVETIRYNREQSLKDKLKKKIEKRFEDALKNYRGRILDIGIS